jgi:hypothetical protein
MAQEAHDLQDSTPAELKQAAEDVARSGQPREVRADGKALTIALRGKPRRSHGRARGRPFTMDDPLFRIEGILEGAGSENVSGNVDKYLMLAYEEEYLSKLAGKVLP